LLLVQCCFCAKAWEEQWVGIGLAENERIVGSLCPQCLLRPPAETADMLRENGGILRDEVDYLWKLSRLKLPPLEGELGAEVVRVMAESAKLGHLLKLNLARATAHHARTRKLIDELSRIRDETAAIINEMRRTRRHEEGHNLAGAVVPTLLDTLEELTTDAVVVLYLAGRLPHEDHWPTLLSEVIEAERKCFSERVIDATRKDIKRVVDDRYHVFLSA